MFLLLFYSFIYIYIYIYIYRPGVLLYTSYILFLGLFWPALSMLFYLEKKLLFCACAWDCRILHLKFTLSRKVDFVSKL